MYIRNSVMSRDEKYRTVLSHLWDAGLPVCMFVMLNPSTADSFQDDPTIRRCADYARRWGYGGMWIANLYAFRATDPKDMQRADDPVGRDNDAAIEWMCGAASEVICAWGAHGVRRQTWVLELLRRCGAHPKYLKLTNAGAPGHPLYLKKELTPVEFGV